MENEESVPSVTVQVVGASRGNPGLAGVGIVVIAGGMVRERVARYLGSAAVLEAQMTALTLALRYARPYAAGLLEVVLDNETVVRQLSGEFPTKHPLILRGLADLERYSSPFSGVIYRRGVALEVAEAQRLADLAIDTRLRPLPAYDRPLPPDEESTVQ